MLLPCGAQAGMADEVDLALGDLVTDGMVAGVPAPGAGRIEAAGATDVYRFQAVAGQRVYLDYLSTDTLNGWVAKWRVVAPDGQVIVEREIWNGDVKAVLPVEGGYRLEVFTTSDTTGSYSFRLLAVPAPQSFAMAVGQEVSDGQVGGEAAPGAGRIESPGGRDVYGFDGVAGQEVYVDYLATDGLDGWQTQWRLKAPGGEVIWERSLWNNDTRTALPVTGRYTLEVDTTSDTTGSYRFKLWAVPAVRVLALAIGDEVGDGVIGGAPVAGAGRIETPGSRDAYTFAGTAGQDVYVDLMGSDTLNGWETRWRMVAPGGQVLWDRELWAQDLRMRLPVGGDYRLEVSTTSDTTGAYRFKLWSIPPAGSFAMAVGDRVSDGRVGAGLLAGAGRIETPGAGDTYTFGGAAGQEVYFDYVSTDALNGWQTRWRLVAPGGQVVWSRELWAGDVRTVLPADGIYRLEVTTTSDTTGSYEFQVLPVPPVEEVAVAVGDEVADGRVNATSRAGAGRIEVPGARDHYRFEGIAGRELFVDLVSTDALNGWQAKWRLVAPGGQVLWDRELWAGSASVRFPVSGWYRLEVFTTTDTTGAYGFRLSDGSNGIEGTTNPIQVGAPTRAMAVDGDLSDWDGVPVLENVRFSVPKGSGAQGTRVVFEEHNGGTWTGLVDHSWKLRMVHDAERLYVAIEVTDDSHENAQASAWNGDSVQLMVATGDRLREVSVFHYALGGVDGALGNSVVQREAGQGSTTAVIRRDAAAGKTFYELSLDREALGIPLSPGARLGLGLAINDGDNQPGQEGQRGWSGLGPHALVHGRTPRETAVVEFAGASPGFPMAVGDTVSDGMINALATPGAGRLGAAGERDGYTFLGTAWQEVYVDALGNTLSNPWSTRWRMFAPDGAEVGSGAIYSDARVTLPASGTYRVEVEASAESTGSYSFQLRNVPPADVFVVAPGEVVSDGAVGGVPSVGAGRIETPGVRDVYLFQGEALQSVYVDQLDRAVTGDWGWMRWSLRGPHGTVLVQDAHVSEDRAVTLPISGEYALEVYAWNDTTGTYSLRVLDVPAVQAFDLALGDVVSDGKVNEGAAVGAGRIETPGARDVYRFEGQAFQTVYVDQVDRTVTGDWGWMRWSLRGPDGAVLVQDAHISEDRAVTLTLPGTYVLEVFAWNDTTGTYRLRVLDVPPPQRFALATGDVVSDGRVNDVPAPGAGRIETPGVRDVYTFEGRAFQKVYVDQIERAITGDWGWMRWSLRAPDGAMLVQDVHVSEDRTVTLPWTGLYVLEVYAWNDTTGTYRLKLWDIPEPQVFALEVGQGVAEGVVHQRPVAGAGRIESPGARDHYTFEGRAFQTVYVDQINRTVTGDSGWMRWSLRGPDGAVILHDVPMSEERMAMLPLNGSYSLEVYAWHDATGTYALKLWDVPPPQQFALRMGDVVSDGMVNDEAAAGAGRIETPGVRDRYTFEGRAAQTLHVDHFARDIVGDLGWMRWSLRAPDGRFLLQDAWLGDDATVTLPSHGTYTLEVYSWFDSTGSYRFQIRPTIQPYLPVPLARPLGTGLDRGMAWRTHQLAVPRPDRLDALEDQLRGSLGPSIHDPAGETNGVFLIPEVNFAENLVPAGYFNLNASGDLAVADRWVPGIPGTTGGTDNIAAEALAFLEFPVAGTYTMGVTSDDGFRVSVGGDAHRALLTLGEYDGGRPAFETSFSFEVAEPGLYPFRLTWMEGTWDSSVEWYSILPDGTRVLVNGNPPTAVRAYRRRNSPPSFSHLTNDVLPELTAFSRTLQGTDPDVPWYQSLAFRLESGPAGMSIDQGVLAWTPSEIQGPSTNEVRVVVSDGVANVTNSFAIVVLEVNVPPTLAGATNAEINELEGHVQDLAPHDVDVPVQGLTVSLVSGPQGLSVTNGVLAWTPTEAQGPSTNEVRVTIGDGVTTVTNVLTLVVREVNEPPSLAGATPAEIDELVGYSQDLLPRDVDIPVQTLTVSLVSGPAGLTVSAGGAVAWPPTEAQGPSTNVVRVSATDGVASVTNEFVVVVREVNVAPVLATVPAQALDELTPLSLALSATDADVPVQALAYALVSGPAGLTVSAGGAVAWTPTEAQGPSTNVVRVSATDGVASVTNEFVVVVREVNVAPDFVPGSVVDRTVEHPGKLEFLLLATDADLPANGMRYRLVSGPEGLAVTSDGVATWVPGAAMAWSTNVVTVEVRDDGTPWLAREQSFRVVVTSSVVPELAVTMEEGKVVLRWKPLGGYHLETATSLANPTWRRFEGTPVEEGGWNVVRTEILGGESWHRLSR